jgi:hypothetical protein
MIATVDPKLAHEQEPDPSLADPFDAAPERSAAPLVRISTTVRELQKDGVYEARFRPEARLETRIATAAVVALDLGYLVWVFFWLSESSFNPFVLLVALFYGSPLTLLSYVAYAGHRDFVVRIANRRLQISRGALAFGGTTSMELEAIEAFVVTDLRQHRPVTSVVNARFIDGRYETLTLGTNDRAKLELYAEHLNIALAEGKRWSNGYRG